MQIIILCGLLFMTAVSQAGTTIVATVGADPSCDYSSITAASFQAPTSELLEIRVPKNYSLTGLELLADRNTTLRGGYDTCSDTTISGKTVLTGTGSSAIFVVVEGTSTTTLTRLSLINLEISGGNSNSNGGVLSLTGSWDLVLNNTSLLHNHSNQVGGAIAIQPASDVNVLAPKVSIYGNSILSNNTAVNGGAIACDGQGSVSVWKSQLAFNDAEMNGGAVFVNNGCKFYQYGGGLFQGILLNTAGQSGGGIAASNDSLVYINSNVFNAGAAFVSSNSAANGGGIFVSGGSRLEALDALINNNSATITGGGIRSTAGHVNIRRTKPGAQCHREVRCSTVSNNSVSSTEPAYGGGGAIATFGGTLEIKGTYIEENSANFGSAIRARHMPFEFDSSFTMVGNVVAKNSNAPQVLYLDETSAQVAFTTFVDNEDMERVIEVSYPTTSNDGHEVLVSGSIFEHAGNTLPSAELTTFGAFPVGDCNRNESASTGDLIGQPRSYTFAIAFEDQAGGDYRLQEFSFPVDRCDSSFMGVLSNVSANGLPRPFDNSVPNVNGPYDLGGLERHDFDLIFKDNFN